MPSRNVLNARIIPERQGPNLLTQEYPKLSGFLQGLMGRAPDEVGSGSVLDEDAQSSRKLQALGAKYGFPIGTIVGMLPFGGGVAKAPSVAAGSRTAQRGIVKLPGGNWLSGSVEDAVKGLRVDMPDISKIKAPFPVEIRDSAVNNWIDSQLVKKYIKNEMATERDPLRLMADAWPEKKAAKLAEVQARIDALTERTRQLARERGQPEHTLVEMRQQMIPLEKEKALIEATEGLHHVPPHLMRGPGNATELRRTAAGFPKEGVAKTDMGRDWEGWSDRAIQNESAGNMLADRALDGGPSPWIEGNPWLAKVPPEVPVHRINSGYRPEDDLGFGHLIDELRNSLNPESGLPKELLMRYQDLPKVTVPQAAERVAQINAWRAAQKREADLLTANNAATVLHKDYPEKGLKWVEMKAPPKTGEKATMKKSSAGAPDRPQGELEELAHEQAIDEGLVPDTPEYFAFIDDALSDMVPKDTLVDKSEKLLADALKYEGDQMAHCVGGYCPDVLEGRSRIFSLRDAKGKPHTTIEVSPAPRTDDLLAFYRYDMTPEARAAVDAQLGPLVKASGVGPRDIKFYDIQQELIAKHPEWQAYTTAPAPLKIKQIKGFKNGKPEDEYLPYVQDFVKSGKWSDVGDLQNTGLMDMSGYPKRVKALGSNYVTQKELDDYLAAFDKPEDFADGGLVTTGYNPSLVNARAAQLEAELFN